MKTRRLVQWIAILAVFTMAARLSVDTDTWWHLRAGKWILDMRSVPLADPFSYTRLGAEWRYPGWLIEVPMYWIHQLLGPGGLNVWTAFMVTAAFAVIWRTMAGGVFTRAFVLILAATVSGVYWAARPYLVTFLLTAVFLLLLEDFRWSRRDRLLWLPLLMVVWANSHGGFAVGFILWGVYFSGEGWRALAAGAQGLAPGRAIRPAILGLSKDPRFRRLLLIGGLLAAAVAVNPSGPMMLLYPFQTVSIASLRDFIQEWQSPNFHELQVQPFLWMLLAVLAAVGVSGLRLALVDFLLVAGFAYLGFLAGRNIALFALVTPGVLTRHLEPAFGRVSDRWHISLFTGREPLFRRRLNLLLAALLALAAVVKAATVYPVSVNQAHFEKTLPVEATNYLSVQRPSGRLFNSYNWGGYLVWALPDYPVFIDGRTDLYNDEIIEDWLLVVRGDEGWQEVLNQWGVNLVLVEPSIPATEKLAQAGWELIYADAIAHLYQRPEDTEGG